MKALQYFGKEDLRMVDIPMPVIGDDDVLLKVRKVGICGTDLHIYAGGMDVPTPLVMGHEFVGEVAEVGHNVTHVHVGDRAVGEHVIGCGECAYCRVGKANICKNPSIIGIHLQGALAEYLRIPGKLVYRCPDEVSDDEAVLVEPLSIAIYAVRKAGAEVGDQVAVIGQGPIGLLVDVVAKASGGTVYGFDRHDNRLDFAKAHGYVSDGINITSDGFMQQFTNDVPEGAAVVYEAVGSDTSAKLALELARPGGKVVILGVFQHDVTLNIMNIVRKELQVFGSWTCISSFEETMQLMKSEKLPIEELITHRYPFLDSLRAFTDASTDKENRIKSIIEF